MERAAPFMLLGSAALFLVNIAAFFDGMEAWLGWGFLSAMLLLAVLLFFRELGGLVISGVAFYGMWRGWSWAWWQAGLVAFPSIAFMIVFMTGGGVVQAYGAVMARLRSGSRAPIQKPEPASDAPVEPLLKRRGSAGAVVFLFAAVALVGAAVFIVHAVGEAASDTTIDSTVVAPPAFVALPTAVAPPSVAGPTYAPPNAAQVERAGREVERVFKAEGYSGLSRYGARCFEALELKPDFGDLDFCLGFDGIATAIVVNAAPELQRSPQSYYATTEARGLIAAQRIVGSEADPGARLTDVYALARQYMRRRTAETEAAEAPTEAPSAPAPLPGGD